MEWIVAILVSLAYWIGFFVAYFIIFKPFDLVMTKEEKAKAYEDALERTREYYNKAKESGDNSAVARYEAIFPQLRESKDERIRKGLIEALKTSKTVGELKFAIPYPEREECIAYLEKQKEQPKEELVYRLNGLMQDYIKEAKDQEEEEHRFKCYQLFWDALEDTGYFEQKEQKPAEWSEEDEKMIKFTLQLLDYHKFTDPNALSCKDWLKSLRPSWKPSELQMEALKEALETYNGFEEYDALRSLYEQLKKLM